MNGAARYPQAVRRSRHRQRGAVAIVAGLALPATMPPFTTTLPRESLTSATGGAHCN